MKTRIKMFLALVFFFLSIILFIYPIFTDKQYKNEVEKKEKEYIETINKINDEKEVSYNNDTNTSISYQNFNELYELLKVRNKEIYETEEYDFIYNTNYEYNDINLSNYGLSYNIFGYLELPSIGITLPIYFGATNSNMKLGAVHLTGTSYPIGGINTNSVIAAHRGYHRTKMFRDIDKIKIGDTLYIRYFMGTLTYKAVKTDVIHPKDINKLVIEENKDMITLISCHPYPFNYQRYVVYFERI